MQPCPSAEMLKSFHVGLLGPGEARRVREHLAECAACRATGVRFAEPRPVDDVTVAFDRPDPAPAAPDSSPAAVAETYYPRIEGYRITGVLGQGGMGIVYRAVQTKLNRAVALKVLPAMIGKASPSAVARFRREATAAARLHHTHIVPIYDFGESRDAYYYAMELIEGRPVNDLTPIFAAARIATALPARVEEVIRSATAGESAADLRADTVSGTRLDTSVSQSSSGRGRPYFQQVARWIADVAEALHYAHGEGIIHRDVKPANLILCTDGRIMLTDFGLARSDDDGSVTVTGALMGTVRYLSPEQAMAKRLRVDHRTDVFSLGATMYELLCFQPAFEGEDEKQILARIVTEDPPAPRKINPAVPADLETICFKALEKSPAARYETARAMADDVRRFLQDLPIVAKRPGPLTRTLKFVRRRRAPVIAAAALVLVAVSSFFTVWAVRSARESHIQSLCDSGLAFRQSGRWEDAEAELRKALAIDPDHVYANLMFAWLSIERFKDQPGSATPANLRTAEAVCRRVLDVSPDDPRALNFLSIVVKRQGRVDEAIDVLERLVQIDGSNFAAWTNLGAYQAIRGDLDEAYRCLEHAAGLAETLQAARPEDRAETWRNFAALQLFRKEPSALDWLNKATHADRNDAPSWLLLARLRMTLEPHVDLKAALGDANYADRTFREDNPLAKRVRALAHLHNAEYAEAAAQAALAIEVGDVRSVNHLVMAVAAAKLGDTGAGRRNLERALKTWPAELADAPYAVSHKGGVLWFESAEALEGLLAEARALLPADPTASAPPP